jgi:hypothetical protein
VRKAEYGQFAPTYRVPHENNIAISDRSLDFFANYKIRDFLAHVRLAGLREYARVTVDWPCLRQASGLRPQYFRIDCLTRCREVSLRSSE